MTVDTNELNEIKQEANVKPLYAGQCSKTGYEIAKNTFDFLSASVVSVLLLIPIIVIALPIMLKDPSCPFYIQTLLVQHGKPLRIVKFRSMKIGADRLEEMLTPEQLAKYKPEYKLTDDPCLIGYKKPGDGKNCFGGKLRRTILDELFHIQINTCFFRNMSVVVLRPLLEEELNYPEEQEQFLLVKP